MTDMMAGTLFWPAGTTRPQPGKLDRFIDPVLAPLDPQVYLISSKRSGKAALLLGLNLMTVLRGAVAVLWLRTYLYEVLAHYRGAPAVLGALGVVILLYLTDAFDGTSSRRWRLISRFGTLMDPVADKALTWSVVLAFVAVAHDLHLSWWWPAVLLTWLAILTEVLIVITTLTAAAAGRNPKAGPKGKHKMFFQSIFALVMLAGMWMVAAGTRLAGEVVLYASLPLMVYSMWLAWQSLCLHTLEIFGRGPSSEVAA